MDSSTVISCSMLITQIMEIQEQKQEWNRIESSGPHISALFLNLLLLIF